MLTLMQSHCMLTHTDSRDCDCVDCCFIGARSDWYEHVQAIYLARQVTSDMAGGAYDVRERLPAMQARWARDRRQWQQPAFNVLPHA